MSGNPFAGFVERYFDDPVSYFSNVLGIEPDAQQREVLNDVAAGERLVSVRSGHGTGKSTALAGLTNWFSITRYPFKVVQTAPTSSQLFDSLWSETAAMYGKLPAALRGLFTVTSDRIVLNSSPKDCFISARTSSKEKPEAMAGVHSANVLLLADEASGIPEEVFESAQGSMSTVNATTILTGNPTRTTGLFYRTHHELSDSWKTHHWSSLKSRFVSPQFIEQIRKTYGEGSNQWRVRVLGEFPQSDDESLISRIKVQEAMDRDIQVAPTAGRVWAVDPARFGTDRTAFCERRGQVVTWLEHKSGLDTMAVAGWVKFKYDSAKRTERPSEILIDAIGVGSGVADRLTELGLPITAVNVSESALMFSDGYMLRDQLWLDMKKWFESGNCKIPSSRSLMEDLVTPQYEFASNGKLKVESKQKIRRRGGRSPDLADVIALTFATTASVLIQGTRTPFSKDVRRNLVTYG